MKKNTLLYLDNSLVERAKRANLNISKLVEEALKQALEIYPPQTAREYLQRVLEETSQEGSWIYGEAYCLPFQIKSIRLENVGPFKHFEIEFRKDAVNIIHGANGSGKSTIVRAILLAFGRQHKHFSNVERAKISLELFPNQSTISIMPELKRHNSFTNGYKCLVADDMLQATSAEMTPAIFHELSTLKIQSIVTLRSVDPSFLPRNANLLSLQSNPRGAPKNI
jgi:ATPase subunit of ABC transporter with duplicated ATPase domains